MNRPVTLLRIYVGLLFATSVLWLSGCGGHAKSTGDTIAISASGSIAAGQSTQLHATESISGGQTNDVTATAAWRSANTSVATVSATGLLTGIAAGTTTISATVGDTTGTLPLTIGAPIVTRLTVTPASPQLFTGSQQQFKAVATSSDGSATDLSGKVTWSVTPANVASINSAGLLQTLAAGSFTVTATSGTVVASASGTVTNATLTSIAVAPLSASIVSGGTQQFTAVGIYNNQSTKDLTSTVTWASSNAGALTISASGLATAGTVSASTAVSITANTASLSGSAAVTVTPAITMTSLVVSPTSGSIAQGSAQQNTATALYSDGSQQDVTSQVTWSVTPSALKQLQKPAGAKREPTGQVRPRDASTGSVTVDPSGVAYATALGAANVQASIGSLQAQGVLLVRNTAIQSLSISTSDRNVPVGATQQLTLTGLFQDGSTQDLSLTGNWQSSNTSIATVDSHGLVTAVSPGTAQFTASFGGLATSSGNLQVLSTDLVSLTVKVPNPVINVGGVQQLSLIGIYADGTTQDLTPLASWKSSNPSVLQVNASGFEQTLSGGRAQVTATVADFSTVTTIEGVATKLVSLEILPSDPDYALGTSQQFTALGFFDNGAQFDLSSAVVWRATDPTVMTINGAGLAKSGKIGSTTITASLEGISATSAVSHVTNATISNITIAPAAMRLAISTHGQLAATGWFSDGSVEDISNDVLWTVSDTTIGSVDLDGIVLGIAPGNTTVTASANALSASAPLTVTNATLSSTVITPGNIEMPVGVQRQFWFVGIFSDGTTQDLSADAIWLSPTPSVVFDTQTGISVGLSPGIGTIGAQLGNFTSATQVNVTNASLTAITLTPASTTIRERGSQQMTATGTFSDGSQQSLYLNAVFSAANPKLVYLRAQGIAIGTGVGSTQITASFRNLQASTTNFTVESGTLQSIALTPTNLAVAAGGTAQLTATGTYADGTTSDLSNQVIWTSSNPGVLSVDANGLATAHATSSPVTVTVTAQTGNVTQSFTVTISPAAGGTIRSLSVRPTAATIGTGGTRQFSATATYADGSTGDVSGIATWTSSSPAVATINSSGLATGAEPGSTLITAALNGLSATATLTAADAAAPIATLISIAVAPATATVNTNATQQFTASGTYSDGTIEDISSSVVWQSTSPSVASVNSGGVATGVSAGTATINALLSGMTGSASLTVNPLAPPGTVVTAVSVTPVNATIAVHATQVYHAVATFSNGASQDVTTSAVWSSSSPGVATISPAGLATGVAVGSAAVGASWSGVSGNAALTVSNAAGSGNPALTSISVTPASTSVAVGATQQYRAVGTYSDGSTQTITGSVTWSSSSPSTASVTSAGLATAGAAGATTITAQSGTISGTAALTVTASTATLVSMVVTPTSSQIITGLSQQFTATGTYSDGTSRDLSSSSSWSSSNPAVAAVNTTGRVTGAAPGTATITCTAGQLQSATTVIISTATLQSLAISPSGASFAVGANQQLTLVGTYSNGSHVNLSSAATWSSGAGAVATVSSTGLVSGTGPGTAQISATYGAQTASTAVQITSATLTSIAVSPASATFAKGTAQQFTVTGTYSDGSTHDVTGQSAFLSSNSNVLNVSSSGLASGVSAGTAQLTVSADGAAAMPLTVTITPATLVSLTVTPANPSFAKGTTEKFTAIGTFSDGTTEDLSNEAVWTSSTPQTATIDDNGLATSGAPGTTQISATFAGVTASSGTVQVSSATLTSLAISPATSQVAKGTTEQFTATGTYSDGSTQDLSSTATWSSSSPTVASINARGLATGDSVGSAQITAAFGNSTASTTSFQVTPATLVSLSFSPANPSVAAGTSAQVTVTGTFSDGSTQNLTSDATYASSNPAAVTVNNNGLITGMAPGSSTVTVTVGGVSQSFSATTTAATLSSIAITPATPASVAKGAHEQFTATGTFSDGSTQDLSSTVTWSTSNAAVLTVDTHGLATGTGTGSATLSAAYQGQSATTPAISVTPAVIASVAVTPADASVVAGSTVQYSAIATYTDSTTQDVTTSATWSSASTTVATVTSTGYAAAVAPGSTTISAQYNSIRGSTSLTVTPVVAAQLTSITVMPATGSIAQGSTQQFTATGVYSDGTMQNLSSLVTWQSSTTAVATINSAGLATGLSGGNTQITATDGGVSGVAILTVSAATLVSLSVTPATVTLANGTSQQYQAMGTLSDGSTQNLTSSVTWTSSHANVATINASGFATSVGVGSTTITAQAGSVSGTAAMTVSSATVVGLQVIPTAVTLPAGGTQQLLATAEFSDGSTQNVTASATYLSANSAVATANLTGLVMATGVGSSSLTVTLGSTTTTVPVVTTSATLASIAVTPANPSLPVGGTQQMTATGTFSDGSTENLTSSVVWSSSAPTIIAISTSGKATVSQTGSATITATEGSTSGSTTFTGTSAVVTGIAVSPASVTLAVGQSQQFAATATLSDGTQQNVTASAQWSTSDASKGTISNVSGTNGLLITTGAGSMIVTATMNAVAGSTPVTVTSALLTSLTVAPSPVSVPLGATQQMSVTGHYSDGSTADVTSTASWTSASSAVATVDASSVLHGVSPGATTVTASVGAIHQGDAATVTNAVLRSISITPSLPTTPLGVQTQLSATGTYSDGSTANLTSQVQWSSAVASVATVSSSGTVTTISAGSTGISATLGSISQQIPLTVTAAVLESISVQATQSSFALGLSLPLTAIGTYSDNSTQNLTGVVTWSSQTPSIGVVSSSGVATGVAAGTFQARASLSGVTGSLSVTVTSAVLQSITVTPANQTIVNLLGNSTQYTATGQFSDGSTQNLTNSCHWAITSGLSVGSISQTGQFSATGVGLGTITATSGTVSGSTNFTVISAL